MQFILGQQYQWLAHFLIVFKYTPKILTVYMLDFSEGI